MSNSNTSEDQSNVFEAFSQYPFKSDRVFLDGLQNILNSMPVAKTNNNENQAELEEELRLVKAKHFYFSRFVQNFDLEEYLKYEQEKMDRETNEKQEEAFERLEEYNYENDKDYTNGLASVIHGWLQEQSKAGLWDKDRLDLEFSKAKAFYYVSRIEKVDLSAYFNWKSQKENANKIAVCPFANLWQNKSKVGPADQTNGASFVVSEKPLGTGAEKITLSSPKSQNVFSIQRLYELQTSIKEAQSDSHTTSVFLTATVFDTINPFEPTERIETKDTKVLSSGLVYHETSTSVSDSNLRQVSLQKLSDAYYNLINYITNERQDPKLIVTFSNGQIPLNAVYLTLGPSFLRVITEHTLLNFALELSHAPIPPLLLLAMTRARTNNQPLPVGLELYLALAAPQYSKLRGPELLYLGLANAFVPEAKLSDAFETAKNMAVCPVASDTSQSVQIGLAVHHSYAGPNRLAVWKENIEQTFGTATSFQDLKTKLESLDSTWSNTILQHWSTLPPVLLNVIFKAVTQICQNKSLVDVLNLEKDLNAKWRQTQDYNQWLASKHDWVSEEEKVKELVAFYFEPLELLECTDEPVVYKVPQEEEEEETVASVCPVTGQKSSTMAACPVLSKEREKPSKQADAVGSGKCPFASGSMAGATCPVTGAKATVSEK